MTSLSLKPHNNLSLFHSSFYSFVLTAGYVGILYLRASTRPSKNTKRDDPKVVTQRLKSVLVFTTLAVFVFVPSVLVFEGVYDSFVYASATLRIFWGWRVNSSNFDDILEMILRLIWDTSKALLLTAMLFSGPLMDYLYFERQEQMYKLGIGNNPGYATPSIVLNEVKKQVSTVFGLRNYIIGPLSEEFVFRAGVLALHLASNVSLNYMIFVTPLYFGVAHIHHAYEMLLEGRYKLQTIVFIVIFQLCYTTVFGWFVSFLFLRLGSVWPPFVVHVFCNSLGPPSFGSIGATKTHVFIYRGLLFLGAYSFYYFLFILTKSENKIL